ncbi:MAG: phasin family protein [Undibacterium sp.]|nr:phasin family protein [Undibacterium sp.]MDO9194427.1 phasin family protein [Undibacterium sp.]
MFTVPEQFSTATKANFDTQLALMTALTGKAFEGVEKFIELNMTVVKTSFEESTAAAKQLFSAKDPQEFFSLSTAQVQPTAEKALAYGRHLATIASNTQAEFTQAAETQLTETNRKVLALFEEVSKNAPAGSEGVVEFVKSAIGNANAGYDQLSKTTKQAVEAIETNMNSAVNQITQAAAKATPRSASKK